MMKKYISPSIKVITYINDTLLVGLSGGVRDTDPNTKIIGYGGEWEEDLTAN